MKLNLYTIHLILLNIFFLIMKVKHSHSRKCGRWRNYREENKTHIILPTWKNYCKNLELYFPCCNFLFKSQYLWVNNIENLEHAIPYYFLCVSVYVCCSRTLQN